MHVNRRKKQFVQKNFVTAHIWIYVLHLNVAVLCSKWFGWILIVNPNENVVDDMWATIEMRSMSIFRMNRWRNAFGAFVRHSSKMLRRARVLFACFQNEVERWMKTCSCICRQELTHAAYRSRIICHTQTHTHKIVCSFERTNHTNFPNYSTTKRIYIACTHNSHWKSKTATMFSVRVFISWHWVVSD